MMDQEELKENVSRSSTWLRGLYVLILALIFQVVELIILAIAVFQFLAALLSGSRFTSLDQFSQDLASYAKNIILYICYQTEDKPFPFRDWQEESRKI
ncbi:MAG: DUF4389 domain-containing protein [Oligoflexus sp.]